MIKEKAKETLRRPVPLMWGLIAMLLFLSFTIVTQSQFNSLNKDRLYKTRMDSYLIAKQQYEALSDERNICLSQVALSNSDRNVFIEITNVLLKMVNLPLSSILSSEIGRAHV